MSGSPSTMDVVYLPRRYRSVLWRVRQFVASIVSRRDPQVDRALRQLVANDAQWRLLERLTPFDRSHHLRVYHYLIADGYDDPDLLLAAVLHDVGKADERGRAGVYARSLRILLRRVEPVLAWAAVPGRTRLLHGLYLAEHHAHLGAELVRSTGASERCCALIANHERREGVTDPLLAALIAADDAAIK